MNNCYFLIRHGESIMNEKGCHQGWISRNPLTKRGILQAEEAAKKLAGQKIELLFASPLLRTKQTARIIGRQLGLLVSFSPRLKDYRRSKSHEGLNTSQYSNLPDYLLWKEKAVIDESFSLSDGESNSGFNKRVTDFASFLDKSFDHKKIAIITHEGVVLQLIKYWINKPIDREKVSNAHIYKVIPETKNLELL